MPPSRARSPIPPPSPPSLPRHPPLLLLPMCRARAWSPPRGGSALRIQRWAAALFFLLDARFRSSWGRPMLDMPPPNQSDEPAAHPNRRPPPGCRPMPAPVARRRHAYTCPIGKCSRPGWGRGAGGEGRRHIHTNIHKHARTSKPSSSVATPRLFFTPAPSRIRRLPAAAAAAWMRLPRTCYMHMRLYIRPPVYPCIHPFITPSIPAAQLYPVAALPSAFRCSLRCPPSPRPQSPWAMAAPPRPRRASRP